MRDLARLTKAELIERLRAMEGSARPAGMPVAVPADAAQLLHAILETAVEGILIIDERGLIESFNPAAEKIFGYAASEVIGRNVTVLMSSPYREEHDAHLAAYLKTGRAKIIGIGREVVGCRKDGALFPMELAVSEVRVPDRRLFAGFVRDITERKRAEAELTHLAAAEEQVRLVQSVVERGFSAVLILNAELPDPRVVYANPAFAQLTGYALASIIGQPLSALSNLATLHDRLRLGMSEGQSLLEETFPFQVNGSEHWGEWRVGPVRDRAGRISHWLAILRDITERRRLEREVLEISDREQRRIGQDLHDGLCQQLAGIELMAEVAAQKLAPQGKADGARLGEIAKHVREAIGQTRLLARGLSPVMQGAEGLMTALQELAVNTQNLFGVECAVECEPPALLPDQAVATQLYRIAQEAVSNAVKHGKARNITMRLDAVGEKYVLSVKDNGSGLPKNISKKGMGLRIMQYRAGMVGGALMVERDLDGGTSVVCSVPRATMTGRASRA